MVLPCGGGGRVVIDVQESPAAIRVSIRLLGEASGSGPAHLLWGVYRGAAQCWHHPQSSVPSGSVLDDASGAMRSPFGPPDKDGGRAIVLTFQSRLAPATLAFAAAVGGRAVLPLASPHFAVPLGMRPGAPAPLGPSPAPGNRGINFAVASQSARAVSLVLFARAPGPQEAAADGPLEGTESTWSVVSELALDPTVHRTGAVWHVCLPALARSPDVAYCWRVDGDESWEGGNRTQPDHLLLDPCAPSLIHAGQRPPGGLGPLHCPNVELERNEPSMFMLSGLATLRGDEQRQAPAAEGAAVLVPPPSARCLLEVNVGAYERGLAELAEHAEEFKALGFNTLVLSECYATAWAGTPLGDGRASVSYWAPDPRLGLSPDTIHADLAAAIAALHRSGLAVLMQIDFTFTAEGNDDGPVPLSFRGLDHSAFYRSIGGVFNAGHARAREYAVDVLRHWKLDYGVDGFVFLGAENLVQDREGFILDAPPLPMSLAFDPVLAGSQLVARTADQHLLPRQGARGFPHWGEWQEDAGALEAVLGDSLRGVRAADMAALADAMAGSPSVFGPGWQSGVPGSLAAARPPHACVNALALEEVRAGDIAEKTALMLTLLAAGTPCVSLEDATRHARFVGIVLRLRRRWSLLPLPRRHLDDPADEVPVSGASPRTDSDPGRDPGPQRVVCFHGAAPGSLPDFDGSATAAGLPEAAYFAFSCTLSTSSAMIYIGVNTSPVMPLEIHLPPAPGDHTWHRLVDTNLEPPEDAALTGTGNYFAFRDYVVQPATGVVFVAGQLKKESTTPVRHVQGKGEPKASA